MTSFSRRMATNTQLGELRRLLTAIAQLHAWQGELLAQAVRLAETGSGRRKTSAAEPLEPKDLGWPGRPRRLRPRTRGQ